MKAVRQGRLDLPSQVVDEEGREKLYFIVKNFPGFSFREMEWKSIRTKTPLFPFQFQENSLEGPFYKLVIDPLTGGLNSLIHKPSGQELVDRTSSRTLAQTHYYDGKDHPLAKIKWELLAQGPVLARLKISGETEGIRVDTLVTLYASVDRVDFDTRLEKPVTSSEQRLCQFFPLGAVSGDWRLETPGAVVRPRPQPEGDLLPGADPRRFAVQNFVDYSPPGRPGVTIVPWEAFFLRLDLGSPAFEVVGNDQNYKEVTHDQFGVSRFRFRYSLRAHPPGYDQSSVLAWSRQVRNPILVASGRLSAPVLKRPPILVDPTRAVATCLKPALEKGSPDLILRLWEIKGDSAPVRIKPGGAKQVFQADLLEREQKELPVQFGTTSVRMPGYGFAAIRLRP
jgi:alpha-mannosidase